MKIKSALVTQVSGSIGGMTGSHNRGGLYLRARSIPTNPSSAAQQSVRNLFGIFSAYWSNLSDAQRDAWTQYGQNVPVTDKLGDSITLSGQQWFVGANTLRTRGGLPIVLNGPTTYTRPTLTEPTSPSLEVGDDIGFNFTNTDEWATELGGGLIVFAGLPQGPGINFFKGPWRFADTVDGAVIPPVSPASINGPFTYTLGQKGWIRVVAVTADGRFSPTTILGPIEVSP